MIPEVNITKPNDWEDLYSIKFTYSEKQSGEFTSVYLNNIITFDIENSTAYIIDSQAVVFSHDKVSTDEGAKYYASQKTESIMYIWACAIECQDGVKVFIGRTWQQYQEFLNMLSEEITRQYQFDVEPDSAIRQVQYQSIVNKRGRVNAFIYIHNLGHEFQFLRNVLNRDFSKPNSVFARASRNPMYAKCSTGKRGSTLTHGRVNYRFTDTVVLVQKKLDTWCEDSELPTKKLAVPQDYYLKIRTPLSKLTPFDIQYSINDVISMVYGVDQYRTKYGFLYNIPLTQTGEVRRKCIANVAHANPTWANHCKNIMESMTLDMYQTLTHAFVGGWTHANVMYSDQVLHDVLAFDFASSYPWVMCAFKYPIGTMTHIVPEMYDTYLSMDPRSLSSTHRYMVEVSLTNVHLRPGMQNTFVSQSKCKESSLSEVILDNGRIYQAGTMTITLTDLDWIIFQQVYDYSTCDIINMWASEADFLPRELILTILEYYAGKTNYKDVAGKETLYNESKQFINSIYGVSVTRLIDGDVTFDDIEGWMKSELNETLFGEKVDSSFNENTFLTYQIGVWVTAFARNNLWQLILKMDNHVANGDTDSLKGPFDDTDMQYINEYNDWVTERQTEVASLLNFDVNMYSPLTPKGEPKQLGIFAREDDCIDFKTLGAKRYAYTYYDKKKGRNITKVTVAGLPKDAGKDKIKSINDFNNNTIWSTDESHKLIRAYNDNQTIGAIWTDEDGIKYTTNKYDTYGVTLLPTTFNLSMSDIYDEFIDFMNNGASYSISQVDQIFLEY